MKRKSYLVITIVYITIALLSQSVIYQQKINKLESKIELLQHNYINKNVKQ